MESDAVRLPAPELRGLAAAIRENPHAREAIAKGFELIAETFDKIEAAMNPCFDCGCPELDDVIDPQDNPEAGA